MFPGISLVCFFATGYLVSLGLEASRLFFPAPGQDVGPDRRDRAGADRSFGLHRGHHLVGRTHRSLGQLASVVHLGRVDADGGLSRADDPQSAAGIWPVRAAVLADSHHRGGSDSAPPAAGSPLDGGAARRHTWTHFACRDGGDVARRGGGGDVPLSVVSAEKVAAAAVWPDVAQLGRSPTGQRTEHPAQRRAPLGRSGERRRSQFRSSRIVQPGRPGDCRFGAAGDRQLGRDLGRRRLATGPAGPTGGHADARGRGVIGHRPDPGTDHAARPGR